MLCEKCQRDSGQGKNRHTPPLAQPASAERLLGLLCARCGKVLPAEDGTKRLLDKLSQLSRFGLGGESPPLLGSSPAPRGAK